MGYQLPICFRRNRTSVPNVRNRFQPPGISRVTCTYTMAYGHSDVIFAVVDLVNQLILKITCFYIWEGVLIKNSLNLYLICNDFLKSKNI